ncbi:hypothetical protein B0H63DRAFT_490610 [Podospora didyma]|uniref:Uncharacterized protein n=1 Tax=Podospora didyma TaxID=330526 RepID=A0AAE0JY97_9PEZI|nr:hypothetical protein B0H63DRAFT_490610 [Podospora didyma]
MDLLQFPVELRLMIYFHLLISPEDIFLTNEDGVGKGYGISPHILLANKQVYGEGIEVLYGENHFTLQGDISSCFHRIESRASLIRHMVIINPGIILVGDFTERVLNDIRTFECIGRACKSLRTVDLTVVVSSEFLDKADVEFTASSLSGIFCKLLFLHSDPEWIEILEHWVNRIRQSIAIVMSGLAT